MDMGRKLLDKWVGMGWKVGVEFTKSGAYFFKGCRKVRVLVEGENGDIPRSVKEGLWIGSFGCEQIKWFNAVGLIKL
jgi:hypothetical protein